jgi:hypothetical protein
MGLDSYRAREAAAKRQEEEEKAEE